MFPSDLVCGPEGLFLNLHRWEAIHIRMGNELCGLHPDEKIRDGSELDAVDVLS